MIKIQAALKTRRWMQTAKAWRCHLELPADKILAAQLTAYIESKVHVTLVSADGSRVDINPAFIVDVPLKGQRFHLIIETVYEKQAALGPYLTGMSGEGVTLLIAREDEPTEVLQEMPRGDLSPAILRGLHTVWFRNIAFWRFLSAKTDTEITSESDCKLAFKTYMQVDSCTHLTRSAFDAMRSDFVQFVNAR